MTPARCYDTAMRAIARWWTPLPIRKDFLSTWLGVLVMPLEVLQKEFLKYRKAKLYQLMITPQVCYLERMLNDSFDRIQRRIRITDAVYYLPWYLYQEAELKPQYLNQEAENDPVYLYTEGEVGQYGDDFVVLVPAAVSFNEDEMKGRLNVYKLAGTRYKIQIVT